MDQIVTPPAGPIVNALKSTLRQGSVPKLRQFYKALYAGMTRLGTVITLASNTVRVGVFGDSVGDFKPFYINARLQNALGYAGAFYNGTTPSAGASIHTDVSDGSYWINGNWGVIPAGGSIAYLYSGARPYANVLKIYYIQEPGGGTFKVQTDSGSGYTDEAGYTNVSASAGAITAGVITLNKSSGSYGINIVGQTGTCRIIGCAWLDTNNGGVAVYHFDVGGLDMVKVMQTPRAVRAAVFSDLALDMASMEWKGETSFDVYFNQFMADYLADIATPTDWVLIGTSPAQDPAQETPGIFVNSVMKAWAVANNQIFFDGYTPLGSWAIVNALGWGGDGLHLAQPAHVFLASLLWDFLGFADLQFVRQAASFRGTGQISGGKLEFLGGNGSIYPTVGRIGTDTNALDLIIQGGRTIAFQDLNGNNKVIINAGGGFPTFSIPWLALASAYATNGPALRAMGSSDTSGMYSSGVQLGDGSTIAPFLASKFLVGTTAGPQVLSGSGSPAGTVTAPVGSIFMRTDGGASTTLYVKESGTGNTGWVAK